MDSILSSALYGAIYGGIAGILAGLIPFFIGKSKNQIKTATQAIIVCGICGVILGLILAVPVAIGYTVWIYIKCKNEKFCPYCKEIIHKDAIICKHCKQEMNA